REGPANGHAFTEHGWAERPHITPYIDHEKVRVRLNVAHAFFSQPGAEFAANPGHLGASLGNYDGSFAQRGGCGPQSKNRDDVVLERKDAAHQVRPAASKAHARS